MPEANDLNLRGCNKQFELVDDTPAVLPTATLVDTDADAPMFNDNGTLDYTKFNEINLTAYGGSANEAVTSDADIIAAFANLPVPIVGVTILPGGVIEFPASYTGANPDIEVSLVPVMADPCNDPSPTFAAVPLGAAGGGVFLQANVGRITSNGLSGDHTVDFGDGSTPIVVTGQVLNYDHQYANGGPWTVTQTYDDGSGKINTYVYDLEFGAFGALQVLASVEIGRPPAQSPTFRNLNCPNGEMTIGMILTTLSAATRNYDLSINGTSVATSVSGGTATIFEHVPLTGLLVGDNVFEWKIYSVNNPAQLEGTMTQIITYTP